ARHVVNRNEGSSESALAAAAVRYRRGLGPAIMRLAVASARKRGCRRLIGSVLATNAPMIAMIGRLGFETRPEPSDREQVIATLQLDRARTKVGSDSTFVGK